MDTNTIGSMENAVSAFLTYVHSGSLYSEYNQCLEFKSLTPPDTQHPSRRYDSFFACLAHHVKGSEKARIQVRDELLCHLGSIVFNTRYERAYDVYTTAMDATKGPVLLGKLLSSRHRAESIMSHGAIKTIIRFGGAYVGCGQDKYGGKLLGTSSNEWRSNTTAFSHAIGCFVRDNAGAVTSFPRNGVPLHRRTQTTCADVFLHLAMDVYPNWRPVLWRYDKLSESIEIVTHVRKSPTCHVPFRPHFMKKMPTTTQEIDVWYNNAKPLYMFYNGIKKRFMLLGSTGLMDNTSNPPPKALFSLRKGNTEKRSNEHVTYLLPHHRDANVHRVSIHDLDDSKRPSTLFFYMICPANRSDLAYRISTHEKLFIYTTRPTLVVADEYKRKRIDRLWGITHPNSSQITNITNNNDKHEENQIDTHEMPEWANQSEYVSLYTSHEARTGVWPLFMLNEDVYHLIVIVATDKEEALEKLRACYPKQPLVDLNVLQ